MKTRVKCVAYKGAGPDIFQAGQERLKNLFKSSNWLFVDSEPDVIYFLTGGSEQSAMECVQKGSFYLMIASSDGNSNASALEVKAALNLRKIDTLLLDEENSGTKQILDNYSNARNAVSNLKGQSLGLIGNVSEWLVASKISSENLKARFGIHLKKVPWESLPDFREMRCPEEFVSFFPSGKPKEVERAGQVFSLLVSSIEKHQFNALTVECFSLVQTKFVSGCLALAMLNNKAVVAACEGDIASAAGMMLIKELTGQVPWMANIAKLGYDKTLLAHCTISPELVSGFTITTHYETGIGTAIAGQYIDDEVTLFRIDETAGRMFVTKAELTGRPQYANACRTQIEVKLEKTAVESLKKDPLGNHHLVLRGDQVNRIQMAARILGLESVL